MKAGRQARASTDAAGVLRPPTGDEVVASEEAAVLLGKRPGRVQVRQARGAQGVFRIGPPHSDAAGWSAQLTNTFGTRSASFAEQSFGHLATAIRDKGAVFPTDAQADYALAMMGAIAPRDELETALGEQIISAHIASLEFLSRARMNAGEYRDTALAYVRAATKLSRTMAGLVETLAKQRAGGRQRIEVVYVNGPAVIGDNAQTIISEGEAAPVGIRGQPHAP